MEIVLAFDRNYVMPAGIMLTSLFENNKNTTIHVHILFNGDGGDFAQPVVDIVKGYNGSISCYDVSNYCFPKLPVKNNNQRAHLTIESYYRLFLTEIITPEIDKVLWLDCDIIVNGDLKQLWEEDITDYAIGCVPDFEHNNVRIMNKLGYDAVLGYFNSGVLLVNLKYWREKNVISAFIDYIKSHEDVLYYCDQDVLNYVFRESKKELNIRYNFQTTFLYKERLRNISCKYFQEIAAGYKSPCVIHFTDNKPWFRNTINPMKGHFVDYQKLTPWKGVSLKNTKTIKQRLMDFVICIKYREKSIKNVLYDVEYINE